MQNNQETNIASKKDICKIYILKCTLTEKVYIGQTWRTLNERWDSGYTHCPKINNAINKYKPENFFYEIVALSYNQDDANNLEDYFIKLFDSIKNGYNLKEGGSNGKFSQEVRDKMSRNRKGKHNSPKSEFKKGQPSIMAGKTHTPEAKAKISKAHKGKPSKLSHLTLEIVNEIRDIYASGVSILYLSNKFHTTRATITNCINNIIWPNQNYIPNYRGIKQEKEYFSGENHANAKLTNEQANKIRYLYDNDKNHNLNTLSEMFNIDRLSITRIINNTGYINPNYIPNIRSAEILNQEQKNEIIDKRINGKIKLIILAKEYNVCLSTIKNVMKKFNKSQTQDSQENKGTE